MKKVMALCLLLVVLFLGFGFLTGCGAQLECDTRNCEQTFRENQGFYGVFGQIMCRDCARQYWIPLDYRNFRVR